MAWQPQEEPLVQLTQCLRDSLSSFDLAARKNAEIVSPFRPPWPRCLFAFPVPCR